MKEFRAVVRPFKDGRLNLRVNMLIAWGSGQTIEDFSNSDISEVVGVHIPSYASVTLTYKFFENRAH